MYGEARYGTSPYTALIRGSFVLILLCVAQIRAPALAQTTPAQGVESRLRLETMATPWSIGTVLTWLNLEDDDRVPIREKPIFEGARRGLIPPRPRRTGFVPRVTLTANYQDNLFFTPTDEVSDFVTVISPGVSYKNFGKNWEIAFDYAFESAFYADNPDEDDFFDGQSAFLIGHLDVDSRTRVGLLDVFRDTRDPTEQLVPGAVPDLVPTQTNDLVLYATRGMSTQTNLTGRYINRLQFTDEPNSSDIAVNEGALIGDYEFSKSDRAGLSGRYRSYRFSPGQDETSYSGFASLRHDLDERLTVEGRLGLLHTTADSGRDYVVGGAAIHASHKDAIYSVALDRDLTTSAGVSSLLLKNQVIGSALFRISSGLQAFVEVGYSNLETVNSATTNIDVVNVGASISYALTNNAWLRFKYTFTQEDIENADSTSANQYFISIVGTL